MTELKDMSYWYDPGKTVIKDVSVEIADGRIYGLLGLNGSGKSTLLKLMAGLLFPKKGQVLCNGETTGSRKPETLQDIAFMPAELSLYKEQGEPGQVRSPEFGVLPTIQPVRTG